MENSNVRVIFQNDNLGNCLIPIDNFDKLDAKIAQFGAIHCSSGEYVLNRIFPTLSPIKTILADDIVRSDSNVNTSDDTHRISFPKDIELLHTICAEKVQVRVEFKNILALSRWQNVKTLQKWIIQILKQYGVTKNSVLKCSTHPIAKLIGICEIVVLNACSTKGSAAKITGSTLLEICDITTSRLSQSDNVQEVKLGGLDDVLFTLKKLVLDHKSPLHSNILILGPSGCGKTSLVQKLSSETKSHLFTIRSNIFAQINVSDCLNLFQDIIQMSKLKACILFLDNLDYISNKYNKDKSKILNLVISILNLVSKCPNITVFGAAVSSMHVHPELKRPGRFSKEILLGVPTFQQRKSILQVLTEDLGSNLDIDMLAQMTPGYVGSDLSLLCLEASVNSSKYDAECFSRTQAKDCSLYPKKCVTTDDFLKALSYVQPSILKNSVFVQNVSPLHWEDVGGLEEIRKRVTMLIEWPLVYPEIFERIGRHCPKGVLLFGPPGCCKTTMVRVLATICNATFFSASPSQIYSQFVGDSEKSISELFREARLCAPSIVFLDEIDALVGNRSYSCGNRGVQEKVLSALLNEMDGFSIKLDSMQGVSESYKQPKGSYSDKVIVVGATNRIDLIDDALLRPGRFDSIVYVPPPNTKQREAILSLQTNKMDVRQVDLKWVAEQTINFSGADLKNLCQVVALSSLKSGLSITTAQFETALKLCHPSITRKQLREYEQLAAKYGSVECQSDESKLWLSVL